MSKPNLPIKEFEAITGQVLTAYETEEMIFNLSSLVELLAEIDQAKELTNNKKK